MLPRPVLVRVDEHLAELRARIGAHRLLDEVEKVLERVRGLETFKVHPDARIDKYRRAIRTIRALEAKPA